MNKNVEKKKRTYNRLHYVLADLRKESTLPLQTHKKQVYMRSKEPSKEEMLMIDRAKYMKIKRTLKYLLKQLD